jgi:hypothetical protein
MDVHLLLGIQRLLDLNATNDEMTALQVGAEKHGPCIEDDLELLSGGGCEGWVIGGKTEANLRIAGETLERFQQNTERS